MKIVKGMVNENAISKDNNNGELVFNDGFDRFQNY
jgi:hypothetical protein